MIFPVFGRRIPINKKRRASLKDATDHLEYAKQVVERVLDEEQDAMDNIPESLQSSERYEQMEEAVDKLDDVVDDIDRAIDLLSSIF